MEVSRGCCRPVKNGDQRNTNPSYYVSLVEDEEEGSKQESEEPRVVVQMDTESPIIYQKTCLDHYFDKPLRVSYWQYVQINLGLLYYNVSLGHKSFSLLRYDEKHRNRSFQESLSSTKSTSPQL